MPDDSRSVPRRRVYLGEGLRFSLDGRIAAEAVDIGAGGLGLAVVDRVAGLPAVGGRVRVRVAASRAEQDALVRHVGRVRGLPLLGLALVPDT